MIMNLPSAPALAEAVSFAVTHGIVMSADENALPGTHITHAPFTLFPSPVDRGCYLEARRISPALNKLVFGIAQDTQYLRGILDETARADSSFTGRLLSLLSDTPNKIQLSICRYDYFVHAEGDKKELRMVEMNTIAASFGGLAMMTSQLHHHLCSHPLVYNEIDPRNLPDNEPLVGIAEGIATAHNMFMKYHSISDECVTVMVVQDGERNSYDQYLLEWTMWHSHGLQLVRASLSDIHAYGTHNEKKHLLLTLPTMACPSVVSVAYLRAGYTPDDYMGENEWEARGLLEGSTAANCPSVGMQLVGTKKIQQVLDGAGVVERFVSNTEAARIRATFARQYSLSGKDGGEEARQLGMSRMEDFVLKPQREGGGNNLFGKELREGLKTMSAEERAGYILMERIRPVVVDNVVVREGRSERMEMVSELGSYGVHVSVDGEEVMNMETGTLLRSKAANTDDGGVAAGVAVLDSTRLEGCGW